MNYAMLSDTELDFEVFKRLYGPLGRDKDMERVYTRSRFRPTRKASDAWPLIEAHRISVEPVTGGWLCRANYGLYDDACQCVDTNPLRAAVLVFLFIQDKS